MLDNKIIIRDFFAELMVLFIVCSDKGAPEKRMVECRKVIWFIIFKKKKKKLRTIIKMTLTL